MPPNSQNGSEETRQWIRNLWPPALAQGLEAMLGEKVESECMAVETELPAAASDAVWWQTGFASAGDGLVWVGSPAAVCEQIGKAALSAVGVTDASAEDAQGTYQEIVSQSLSAIAQGLARKLGRDVACINGKQCQRPDEPRFVLPAKLIFSLEECAPIWLAVSAGFDSLFAPAPSPEVPPATAKGTMDLLLDVELPVSVSFGRTHLALKDVIKLTTGSIVELNRSIAEPVEVIVNNCVIARGEVVVIEGNYGVRIQQIISRQERLRTLH
jgi:flagellar motor switch protein FliN